MARTRRGPAGSSSNNRDRAREVQGTLEVVDTDVEPIEIQEEMERSFLDYAMSVIVSRALPDARDGLKPVHRRILYAMLDQGIRPDRPHIKCARVVGDVMGRFHPHGELAIYDALVRMAQDFSLREPLIDGHGNFGSTGPDEGPAAMRYTECRLSELAMVLMEGIEEETVDFIPNYDGSESEPVVLPGRFPNLLVNGSQGIAVGMATNIPPHNLAEVIAAAVHYLEHPQADHQELMRFVKGPDFPTGALILGRSGIEDAYRTGRGSIKIRAVAEIDDDGPGQRIVVTELPYQTSVEVVERKIADLVRAGELDGIARTQNDSAGRQPRLVIELKRDANANVVLNNLFKHTPMQVSFGIQLLALVDGVPRILSLCQMIAAYAEHQLDVVRRRSRFRLKKAKDRAHIVEGLLRAIDMLDAVVALIRGSADRSEARQGLMTEPFSFSEIQANHILDLTLGRLTRLGRSELETEMAELTATIAELESILGDEAKLTRVVISEMNSIAERFGNQRRTKIVADPGEMSTEDLIEDEEVVVTLTKAGYIKSVSAASFRTQQRGGRGVKATSLKEEDLVVNAVHTSSHSSLLLFSNLGKVYKIRVHEIPTKERTARGVAIVNLLPLQQGEVIQAMVATKSFGEDKALFFATRDGQVKKTPLLEYDKSRREGFIAIGLREGDQLVQVVPIAPGQEIVMVSAKGMAIRFSEQEVRVMGRSAAGVRGMRLKPGDSVVACDVVRPEDDLLILTDQGYGKRTKLSQFSSQGRGGQGIRGIRLAPARGVVAAALLAKEGDDLLLVSSSGVMIRTPVADIARQGRDATGVRVMAIGPNEKLSAAAVVSSNQ